MKKLALIKVFLNEFQRKTHSLTFDYLIASINQAKIEIDIKICYSLQEIKEYKPDIVGISTVTESYMIAKQLAKDIKKELGSIVIIGGTHITALPQTMSKDMDIAIIGEGERTIVEILKLSEKPPWHLTGIDSILGIAYWKNGKLFQTNPRLYIPMDELPIPIHPNIKYDFGEAIAILTTRGCVNRCVHCSEQKIWRPFRYLSGKRLAEIIDVHYKRSGITDYVFMDDISVFNLKRLVELKEELIKRNIFDKIKIVKISTNSEIITEDIVKILKELGLRLAGFGLESASSRILKEMKRGRVTIEDFKRCITLFGKYGIRSGASTVWGFPGETLEDMEKNKKFLVEWNGKYQFKSFMQYCCQPLPGSDLWDMMYAKGKVSLDMDFSTMKIHPKNIKENWLYINEDTVNKEDFIKFLNQTRKEIREAKKNKK